MGTFTDTELTAVKSALDSFLERKRPREEIRDEVDLSYRIEGQSVVIIEVRQARAN